MNRFAWMLLALISTVARAHPVDEVVQGAYLTLTPGKVQLELNVTPGAQVAGVLLKALDPNGDGQVSTAEARTYAGRVLNASTLTLNGRSVRWTLDRVSVPSLPLLKLGGDTVKIYATAPRLDRSGTASFTYANRYQPAKSQWVANVFLQPTDGWHYAVTKQTRTGDGRALTVTYTASRS